MQSLELEPTLAAPPLLFRLTAAASLGGLLFGFDTGVISGALPYLRDSLLGADSINASR
jgi:hypothetical protein